MKILRGKAQRNQWQDVGYIISKLPKIKEKKSKTLNHSEKHDTLAIEEMQFIWEYISHQKLRKPKVSNATFLKSQKKRFANPKSYIQLYILQEVRDIEGILKWTKRKTVTRRSSLKELKEHFKKKGNKSRKHGIFGWRKNTVSKTVDKYNSFSYSSRVS